MKPRLARASAAGVVLATALEIAGLAACSHYAPRPLDARQSAREFSARRLDAPDLAAFVAAQPSRHDAPWPPKRFALDDLTWVAIYYQPRLEVVRAAWAVARAGIRTAGARPNPSLQVLPTYTTNPASLTPWLALASLDVPIETAGKREKRIEVASHEAEAARWRLLAEAWRARGELRGALIRWVGASDLVQALARKVAIDRERSRLLEARFRAGEIARPDLTAGRLLLLQDEDALAVAKRDEATARVAVAESLGVPREAIRNLTVDPASLAPEDVAVGLAHARRAALTHRADLMAALADYAARESQLRLEVAKQYPDLHLGPGYEFDQGENKWSVGLSLELPLLNRNQGPIAEAEARRREAGAQFEATQAHVIAEIESAEADWRASSERMTRVDALRDAAERRLASMDRSFVAGEIDRLQRDAAALEAADAAVRQVEARTALRLATGRLEDALERPLAALSSVAGAPEARTR